MKFKVIIFCILVFCSQIVVSFPFEEEEVRQRARQTNSWPVDNDTPGQYHHTNFARPHNAAPAHHQNYKEDFGRQDRNYDNFESNSHARAPVEERKKPFRNPIDRSQEFGHQNWRPHNQFVKPAPPLAEENRHAIRENRGNPRPNLQRQGHFSSPGQHSYRNIDRNPNYPIPRGHQRENEQYRKREQFADRPSYPRRDRFADREREHNRPINTNVEHPVPNNPPSHSGFNKHYAPESEAFADAGFPHEEPKPLPVHEPNRGHRTKDIPASPGPVHRRTPPKFSGYDKSFEPKLDASDTGFTRDIPKRHRFPENHRGHPIARDHTRDLEEIPVQHKKYAPLPEFNEPMETKSEPYVEPSFPHETVAKPHRIPNEHQGHHHKDIEDNLKEILGSSHKRFVVIHPNGTVENLDKLDPTTQHNKNYHTVHAKPDGTIEYEDHNGPLNPEDYNNDKGDTQGDNRDVGKISVPDSDTLPMDSRPDDHEKNRDLSKLFDPVPEKSLIDDKTVNHQNNPDFKKVFDPVPEKSITDDEPDVPHNNPDLKKRINPILEKFTSHKRNDDGDNRDFIKKIDAAPENYFTEPKPDEHDNSEEDKKIIDPVSENHHISDHHDDNKPDLKKIFETFLEKHHADDFVPNYHDKKAETSEHDEAIHDPLKDLGTYTTVPTPYESDNSTPPRNDVKSHDETHDEIITIPPEEMSTDNVKDVNPVTESAVKQESSAINATLEIFKNFTIVTPTYPKDDVNTAATKPTETTTAKPKMDRNMNKGNDTVDTYNSTISSDSNKNNTIVSEDTTEVNATDIHVTENHQNYFATTSAPTDLSVVNPSKFENSTSFLGSTHVTDNLQTILATTSAPERYDTVVNQTTFVNSSRIIDSITDIVTAVNNSASQSIDDSKRFVKPAINDSNTKVDDHDIKDDSVTVTTSSSLPSDVHTVATTVSTIPPVNNTLESKQPKEVTITLSIPADNQGDTVSVSVDIPPEDAGDHSDTNEEETLVVNISTKNATETSSAKPCASDNNPNSDKNVVIDLSVNQEKPIIWVRTTDENILDKLSAGKDKVVYFFNVGPQALVNRDTTRTIYENGTTVIDITETIYEHKDDKTPKVVKTTQIINP